MFYVLYWYARLIVKLRKYKQNETIDWVSLIISKKKFLRIKWINKLYNKYWFEIYFIYITFVCFN